MDGADGCFSAIGGLFALLLLASAATVAGLLLTSHAVLYREIEATYATGYVCSYFTGFRTVDIYTNSTLGCERFKKIGE